MSIEQLVDYELNIDFQGFFNFLQKKFDVWTNIFWKFQHWWKIIQLVSKLQRYDWIRIMTMG
jgi:hypothetical protein